MLVQERQDDLRVLLILFYHTLDRRMLMSSVLQGQPAGYAGPGAPGWHAGAADRAV